MCKNKKVKNKSISSCSKISNEKVEKIINENLKKAQIEIYRKAIEKK
jgi:hypothetical protein